MPTGTNRSQWRWSLATRLAVAWALSLGIAVGISSWATHRDSGRRLLEDQRRGIMQDLGEVSLRLETWSQGIQEDVRSCSQSPLVSEFLRRRGSAEEPPWRQLLEGEFRSVFAGKPSYFQMRLLAADGAEEGDELIRLDRRDGRLEVTPRDRLQSKADRAYFRDIVAMAPGEIYLSGIDLNRDFGRITEPHTPTIRAAVKIGSGGEGAAILIINADTRQVFAEVRELASPGMSLRIFDSGENYLLHPDAGAAFRDDLGSGKQPREEFSKLGAKLEAMTWLRDGGTGGDLALATPVDIPQPRGHVIHALLSLDEGSWLPAVQRSRRRAIFSALLAALAGAGVALLISLPFASRLRHLSAAMRQFDVTRGADSLPAGDTGKDEIGVAIERFREMAIKVREQVESLEASRHEAEEANASKEQFLAVMSHEIRTPMNAVVGLIRALEANRPGDHQAPIINSLRASSDNLMTLLNTALDYTRLREGVIEFSNEPFDAARAVSEVAQAFRPMAMAKGLEFRTRSPKRLKVLGDALRFRQIINNLASNAVKFTSGGFVEIALRNEAGNLICEVIDSGSGIAQENLEKIFRPFASLEPITSTSGSGAGLGLAVSRQLAAQLGGGIEVESELGNGSTFRLSLPFPIVPDEHRQSATGVVRAAVIRAGLRILCVEDLASNRQVMELTLDGTGCDLAFAETGAGAIAAVERREFDVVLVDLQLPDTSGCELAREILARHPALPLIAVTAQASERVADDCRAAGIGQVVLKPYTREEILAALEKVCDPEFVNVLESLHPDDPARARALATTMAVELRAAIGQLTSGGGERSGAKVRDVRHKLTTAIARFQFDELGEVLDRMVESGSAEPDQIEKAVGLLSQAAERLDAWGADPGAKT